MKKAKIPRPPRCLCSNVFNWVLGIISPSLYANAAMGGLKTKRERDEVEKWVAAVHAYYGYDPKREEAEKETFTVDTQQMAAAMRDAVTKAGLKGGDK